MQTQDNIETCYRPRRVKEEETEVLGKKPLNSPLRRNRSTSE